MYIDAHFKWIVHINYIMNELLKIINVFKKQKQKYMYCNYPIYNWSWNINMARHCEI